MLEQVDRRARAVELATTTSMSNAQIGRQLGVDRVTITRDLKAAGIRPDARPRREPPFECLTVECDGIASSRWGRHAYCGKCKIKRGTATPDGRTLSGLIPTAPGSRAGRDHGGRIGKFEKHAFTVVAAARSIDHALQRRPQLRADLAGALEAWQLQQRLLSAAGRELDQQLRRRATLAQDLDEALRSYRAAVDALPELGADPARAFSPRPTWEPPALRRARGITRTLVDAAAHG